MSKLVTIRTFDTYLPAQILKGRLESEGIPCHLKDEQSVTMYWFWSGALGGVKVQVLETDRDSAEALIRSTELQHEAEQATPGFWDDDDIDQLDPGNRICIHCGSRNTRRHDYKKRRAFLSILLLGFPLMFRSDRWHCFHCGEDF